MLSFFHKKQCYLNQPKKQLLTEMGFSCSANKKNRREIGLDSPYDRKTRQILSVTPSNAKKRGNVKSGQRQ